MSSKRFAWTLTPVFASSVTRTVNAEFRATQYGISFYDADSIIVDPVSPTVDVPFMTG